MVDGNERDARGRLVTLVRSAVDDLEGGVATLAPGDFAGRALELAKSVEKAARGLVPALAGGAAPAPSRLGDLLGPAFERFRLRVSGEERPVPVPWKALAGLVGGGLWPGVHFVGGGTGVGKTAWSMQLALHAAREGVPVLYIGLEMGPMDAVARAVSLLEAARPDVFASELMHGRCAANGGVSALRLDALEGAALSHLGSLPFELEAGDAHGWDYSQLVDRVGSLRERYEVASSAPVLVVLDFLQLVDSPRDRGRREELRERITRASYQARAAAHHHNAAVLLVSSTSRENERALRQWGAGWPAEPVEVTVGKSTSELSCGSFIGIGKESGDIEYSAESLLVLARAGKGPGSTTRIRVGAPKTRYGKSGESATLLFNGSRWTDDDETDKAEKAAAVVAANEKKKADKAEATAKKKAEAAAKKTAKAGGSTGADKAAGGGKPPALGMD